jgi:hypothetical protein
MAYIHFPETQPVSREVKFIDSITHEVAQDFRMIAQQNIGKHIYLKLLT